MEDINMDVIQWRKLWQFVSGIHYGTPNAEVKVKLLQVSKELVDGILHYKKPSKESEEKLQKLIKDRNQLKLQPFANKLHQYLDIDAIQSWQILCFYLVNEYRGAATALAEYISTETSMVKLLHDIWVYHTIERMVQLKVVKNLLNYFHSGSHPYSREYRDVVERIGLPALRKSYLAQLKHLIADPLMTHKTLPNDAFHAQTKVACAERRLRETSEVLQILLLIVHYSGINPGELDELFGLFREHSFGRQQEYIDVATEIHAELVKRITYNELALVFRTLDLSEKFDDTAWIEKVVNALDGPITALQQFPEHGPLLLVWMLFNFRLQHSVEDEDVTRRYQQLGSRAIKLGVFEYLHGLVSHPMFKDNSLPAKIVRKSIFNHVGFLCQLFDARESIAHHGKIFDLVSELLTSPTIATEFCKTEDHPIRALFNICVEQFPVEFLPLSKVAFALASAGSTQNAYIQRLLENLPVYTELYNDTNAQYIWRKSATGLDDEFVLCSDYTPSNKIEFTMPRGTKLIVNDVHSHRKTYVHFRTRYNFFSALHHEINELLFDAQATSTLSQERVLRIATGLKYLAVAVKRIQQPLDISAEMVHPTEMVFDVLLKFKSVPNPPIDLLVQCLNVCSALVPLFEQEIFTRIMNLNILPTVNNATLSYKEYANGASYDSSLIGYYLMNVERIAGSYPILMAYFNLLKTYTKLGRDNVFGVELPGTIFLLREVLPHANNWRYETGTDRYRVLVFVVQYIYEILQLSEKQLCSDPARRTLRDVCVFSLLNRDNGMVLLKIVGLGNGYLQAVMERETNWMMVPEQQLNLMIQYSMTILMQILRLKGHIQEYDLSPLESAIYTQPKQRDTLRIIPMVTGYMSNIFNPRLPILSCRLLRRFAIEFRMSLLACLDMEADQIRHTFLERLHDDIESEDLKLAVLELVEACVHKQPGLTEAFFKVNYAGRDRRLVLGPKDVIGAGKTRPRTMISDGIPTYMEEFLEAIMNEPSKLASPLLSRLMSLFHALWKNNMQALVQKQMQKPSFWPSLCNPLFGEHVAGNIRAYSQLFNILGIELFRVNPASNVKMDAELSKVFERFIQKVDVFERWVNIVFDLPPATDGDQLTSSNNTDSNNESSASAFTVCLEEKVQETPDWLGRLQSFKDLLVLVIRKREPGVALPDRCKAFLAERCLSVLVVRIEAIHDMRPLIVLAELYLIVLSDFENKYTADTARDDQMLRQMETLLSRLSVSYADIHQRAKEAILVIAIKTVEFQSDRWMENGTIAVELTRSAVDIAAEEINTLEMLAKSPGWKDRPASDKTSGKLYNSLLLAINLLKQLTISFDQHVAVPSVQFTTRWVSWFVKGKLFQRLLSITGTVLPEYEHRKLVVELMDLLILLAESRCSEELLYCDVGDYLWLKLLPPKELLVRPYVVSSGTEQQWQTQDWWPIYSRGIRLVRLLLSRHGHRFLREAIFFIGIHEEYLMDSLLLAKQSLEPSAYLLINETLQLVSTMVAYEKQWRLEHSQSLLHLMRCTQYLMDYAISLLYRPKILKRLITGSGDSSGFLVTELDIDPSTIDASDELVKAMNNLIEIVILCTKALLAFSPTLSVLLCDAEFAPSTFRPLVEIQFGAPKISTDNFSQLSFGSLLQAACIFTKVLNLQHHAFSETALNELPVSAKHRQGDGMDDSTAESLITGASRSGSITSHGGTPGRAKRSQFAKTLSMTSVSSYTSSNAITLSNELLTHLDTKLCIYGLEFILTLLASQSLLALKDVNLSQREKQLIKRELSTELLIFHDFVKRRILKDAKSNLARMKHGVVPISNEVTDIDYDDQDDDTDDRRRGTSATDRSKGGATKSNKRLSSTQQHSMRISVVRKMHLQKQHQESPELSGPGEATPVLKGILKPSPPSTSVKRVMFDDDQDEPANSSAYIEPEDEPVYYEPQEPQFTGLSYVQMVEEDYLHLLSNVLLIVGQSEN